MNIIHQLRSYLGCTATHIANAESAWRGVEMLENRALLSGTLATETQVVDIADGTSNTMMIGEKHVRTSQTLQVTIVQDV